MPPKPKYPATLRLDTHATSRPTHKAIIDRCRRTILGRAIAPATATFQHVHDAADDAAIVRPLDAPYIRRQVRFDAIPLLIAQPKQVPAHAPDPLPKTNQNRIVRPEKLMSSDPSQRFAHRLCHLDGSRRVGMDADRLGTHRQVVAGDRLDLALTHRPHA